MDSEQQTTPTTSDNGIAEPWRYDGNLPPADDLPLGWFWPSDIARYRWIYQNLVPEHGMTAEIGCHRGRSLASVADIIAAKDIHVTAVDTFQPMLEGQKDTEILADFMENMKRFGIRERTHVIRGLSTVAADQYATGYFDFVFIDADHTYSSIKADISAWAPKLKTTGVMAGHDYNYDNPGVMRAVDECFNPQVERPSSIWLATAADIKAIAVPEIKLAIGLPTYGPGGVGTIPLVNIRASKRVSNPPLFESAGSALTLTFNSSWCWALNGYLAGHITHFLMLHSDVRPLSEDWLDVLIGEMEKSKADVLSAIIPIKDGRGLTSTAFESGDPWRPVRITQRQAHQLPVTWTCEKLLNNTGLMLIKLDPRWVEWTANGLCFEVQNSIVRDDQGLFQPRFEPEDWRFSRDCHKLGVRLFVTRAVPVYHFGNQAFPSTDDWGWENDQDNAGKLDGPLAIAGADGAVIEFDPFKKAD